MGIDSYAEQPSGEYSSLVAVSFVTNRPKRLDPHGESNPWLRNSKPRIASVPFSTRQFPRQLIPTLPQSLVILATSCHPSILSIYIDPYGRISPSILYSLLKKKLSYVNWLVIQTSWVLYPSPSLRSKPLSHLDLSLSST